MNTHIEKIGAIRKMAQEREALFQVVAILEELGNIDEQLEQARQRIAKVREDETNTRNLAQAALVDLDSAQSAIAAARTEAQTIVDNAHHEAETVINAANESAAEQARLSEKVKQDARQAVAAAHEERELILAQIKDRQADLETLNQTIERARAAARAVFNPAPDASVPLGPTPAVAATSTG